MTSPLTCIDLFCGCGGFTLGMQRAGYRVVAAVDFNAEAIQTLKMNLGEGNPAGLFPVAHALHRDLTKYPPGELARLIGLDSVDVIVGGPPCQGFSTARQVDGANHGDRLTADPRRYLYREFLRYVGFFKPRIFIMENVLGIRSAAGGEYFTRVQSEARELGYRVHGQIENAEDLGVPQKRRRQLFIGVRNDLPGYFIPEIAPAARAKKGTKLGHAIGDLPILSAGEGSNDRPYDYDRRDRHTRSHELARNYLGEVLEVDLADRLTNHVARPHSERDLRDFAKLAEGDNSALALRRGVVFEFPYDTSSFTDRYTRQHRERPCSTIVAHLSKDGLMFIHPVQLRSLTPREAARVQSFPDWFRFPSSRTHAFRLIGNAVPPLIGEAVGLASKAFLSASSEDTICEPRCSNRLGWFAVPASGWHGNDRIYNLRTAAAFELQRVANLDRYALRDMSARDFLRGWHALLFLFPGLHPDNALDHGRAEEPWPDAQIVLPNLDAEKHRRYARSGWPVALEAIGLEAWRRYRENQFSNDEFYCREAQSAGMRNCHTKMN